MRKKMNIEWLNWLLKVGPVWMEYYYLQVGICGASCGLCCSQRELCDKCRVSTMKANGLPEEWAEQLKGLAHNVSGYSDPFEFSEVAKKLREMMKRSFLGIQWNQLKWTARNGD